MHRTVPGRRRRDQDKQLEFWLVRAVVDCRRWPRTCLRSSSTSWPAASCQNLPSVQIRHALRCFEPSLRRIPEVHRDSACLRCHRPLIDIVLRPKVRATGWVSQSPNYPCWFGRSACGREASRMYTRERVHTVVVGLHGCEGAMVPGESTIQGILVAFHLRKTAESKNRHSLVSRPRSAHAGIAYSECNTVQRKDRKPRTEIYADSEPWINGMDSSFADMQ